MLAEFGEDVVLENIQAEEARAATAVREEPNASSSAHSSAARGADLGFDLHDDERHDAAFDPSSISEVLQASGQCPNILLGHLQPSRRPSTQKGNPPLQCHGPVQPRHQVECRLTAGANWRRSRERRSRSK